MSDKLKNQKVIAESLITHYLLLITQLTGRLIAKKEVKIECNRIRRSHQLQETVYAV